VEAVN